MANGDATPLGSFVEHLFCGPFAKGLLHQSVNTWEVIC